MLDYIVSEIEGFYATVCSVLTGIVKEKQANQASALTFVTNAIIVWNTVYMQAVIDQLKEEGYVINPKDLSHISPCRFEQINKHGKLTFNVNQNWNREKLRPLRKSSTQKNP